MANSLMFEVGVKEAGTQLTDLEKRLKKLTSTYGKMELNVDFKSSEDLKTFVNALRMLGDGKVLDPLLKRIEQLQVSMVRLGMIPNDINYTALEQQLNKLSEAYKNLDKARGTSAETARQQAANLLKSNIEKEFGMPVNVLNAVMDTYKNMGNTIQENLSKVASSVSSSTKQSNTALEQESSAVTETVQKLNALVAEKQQVVNAEKQLAESSTNTASSVANEGKQAKATSEALDTVTQSNKKAGDQAAQTGQQLDTLSNKYLNLASSIENRLSNQSKLLESGSSHYDAQLRQSISAYQLLYEDVKKAIIGGKGADVFANLKTQLSGLDIAFANVNKEAQAFRRTLDQNAKAEERQINAGLKAEETAGRARVKERERQEKQYEQIWQKGLRDRETAAQKAARTEAKSAQDASVEYTRLQGVLERLTQLRSNAVGAKVDTAEIDVLISKIKTLQTLYSEIALGNGRSASGLLFGDLKGNPNTRSTMLEIGQVFTETNNHIRENNRLSRESEKESRAKAAAEVRANKDVQNEIGRTKAKIEELNAAIARGRNAGRDMSVLESQRSRLEGQKMLLENLTAADKADRAGLDKRLDNVKALRDESVRLQKTENELTKAREQANKANDRKAIKNLQDEEKSVNDAYIKYNKLTAKILEMEALLARGQKANIDTTPVEKYIEYLNRLRTLMDEILSNKGRTINSSATNSFKLSQGMLTSQVLGHNNTRKPVEEYSLKVFKKDLKETEAQIAKSESYIKKLGIAFNSLNGYMKVNGGSEEMKRLQTEIQGAIRKMRDLMNAGNFAGAINVYERLSGIIRQAASATKEFEKAQQGVSGTVSHTNSHLQNQSQILSDLKTMAMQYLSVWGAQSFINNIIELGGQLEQQRLSIGAILQDTAQANHLFGQIKDLAIRSPFGVQQLDAMTKQLSAYGFQYSELYEWTKRLADISAATGTSVDRLALALGHVRSEGALSGYTLRQFSMGNIPLLQKLSENLGKTKQEIRKMTRNKEIGYEDVLNVLKQLTDESGMFYQAQETMAEALNAKFKNLRDSFQIMYSEMAEGAPGDFLKGVAEVLTDISKSWRVLMPIILSGAGALGLWKLSTMALNHELQRTGALMTGNAMATSKYSVAQLRAIATTGRWTLALRGLKAALMSIGKFVFNPVTMGFAAIEGLVYLWSKHNEEVRKAADLTKAFGETAVESQKNIGKMLENIEPYSDGMDDSAMKAGIDSMTEAIKNYGVNGQKTLNDIAESADTVTEKYKLMREELEKTSKVYDEMKRTADAFEYGINATDQGWGDDNVETDLTNYAEALKKFDAVVTKVSEKYGDNIYNILSVARFADKGFADATKNMTNDAEKLAELFANLDKYQKARDAIKPWTQGQEFRDVYYGSEGFLDLNSKRKEAMRELDTFISETESYLSKHGYDFTKDLAPEQVGNLLKQSKDWLEKHPEWENIYNVIEQKLENQWGIKFYPDVSPVEEELPEWMQAIQDELDQEKTGIKINANMSMQQIIEEARKAYQAAETTINMLGPIAIKAGIKLEGLTDEVISKYGPNSEGYNPELYNELLGLKKALDKKGLTSSFAQKRGLDLKGMRKDGTHKAEKQNQEAAKAVRERVRVIKEAADAFQYWREKVGDKGAWEHVQAEFGDVLNKINITADNIEDVRGHLKKIKDSKDFKAITDKKIQTETEKELAKEEDQFIRKDFERDTERFLSKTQIELDNLTRSWETFNAVRESTGNIELAVQLSGAQYTEGKTRNLADSVREKIERDFVAAGAVTIPFDINLSDEQIQRQVEEAFHKMKPVQMEGESKEDYQKRLSDYESKIKGITEETKKWRDLQRDVYQRDIQNYAKVLGGLKDYHTQLQQINDEYNQMIESLDNLLKKGDISVVQYTQAQRAAEAKRDSKQWHLEGAYGNLYANFMGMAQEAFTTAYEKEIEDLNNLFDTGAIDAEEFANKINKLNEMQREFSTQGFLGIKGGVGAFLSGGWQGMKGYYQQRMNASYLNMVDARKKYGTESAQYADAEKEYQYNKDKYDSMEKQEKAAESLVFAFQQLANGANLLSDLFKNMGFESGSNAMSDAGGLLSSALGGASSLSALGPWGMAAGAGIGLVSGIFALYDKQIQRQIDALKENAAALQENTDAIKTARERTLGYDYTGELRKRMAQQYDYTAVQHKHFDSGISEFDYDVPDWSQIAMMNYYSKNSNRSGYQAELENLKEQRALYMEMYNLENSKKNQSDEALREYREKVAELDDQILYFVEDFTNELWGIDFKSWADQISDALWTAFENGEDALDAFHDAAKDIISDVAKRMMNIHLIEPVFSQLEDALFGPIGSNGQRSGGVAYNAATGQFNEEETLRILGRFFGEDGEFAKVINSAEDFYKMAERATGFDFTSEDSSRSTSSGIKSITEQTADILAGYVNSIRADVSVNRNMIAQYFPMYYNALTSGNASLTSIRQHTESIMKSADAIERSNQAILDNINGLKNKAWKVPMA